MSITAPSHIHVHQPSQQKVLLQGCHTWAIDWQLYQLSPNHRGLVLNFTRDEHHVATGIMTLGNKTSCHIRVIQNGQGKAKITLYDLADNQSRWTLFCQASTSAPALVILERGHHFQGQWQLQFNGKQCVSHQGLDRLDLPMGQVDLRLGAASQFGQLFNLREYAFAVDEAKATGILAIRNGHWTCPTQSMIHVTGQTDILNANLRLSGHTRRSYILADFDADQLEPSVQRPYESWGDLHYLADPANLIATHGFARPGKLKQIRQRARLAAVKPENCVLGCRSLQEAITLADANPQFGQAHPLWAGDYNQARKWTLHKLERFCQRLCDYAFLAPGTSPVDIRQAAPAMACFHMLDCLGHITHEQRLIATEQIAIIANLLLRRDYYPWDVATIEAGKPGSVQSIYRGMLNQNFNTDRYTAIGMAGCILSRHPDAIKWRNHFKQQLDDQLNAFAYPGGAWEESHTYHQHVLLCLLPTMMAIHNVDGDDLLADTRFDQVARFFINLFGPKDQFTQTFRAIPAIGDHGYPTVKNESFSFLYGWMAQCMPHNQDTFCWAWCESGQSLTNSHSTQTSVFSPLMILDPRHNNPTQKIHRSTLLNLPGYGALARMHDQQPDESLLVVRCGEAWAHYHPDQGSFWWWSRGQLICCDAGMGEGESKLKHNGHNVLGYPAHQPIEHLDRVPYQITHTRQTGAEQFEIQCSIPIWMWQSDNHQPDIIAPKHRPGNTRAFHWQSPDELHITDIPFQSPDGVVTWTLHAPAYDILKLNNRQFLFKLSGSNRSMLLELPQKPTRFQIHKEQWTCGITCFYPEKNLYHKLICHSD